MPRFETFHRTIAQSGSVSSMFGLAGAKSVGLFASVVTSCEAYLQVSFDTSSANFVRAGKKDGSGDFVWSLGPGSLALSLQDTGFPFPFAKIETSVAQEAVRSLSMVVKL